MAWCISSQETTEVVQLLFKVIKECSPDVEIRTLMTDDGKQYSSDGNCYGNCIQDDIWHNGGKAVFGSNIRHLLCHWHVDRYVHTQHSIS